MITTEPPWNFYTDVKLATEAHGLEPRPVKERSLGVQVRLNSYKGYPMIPFFPLVVTFLLWGVRGSLTNK